MSTGMVLTSFSQLLTPSWRVKTFKIYSDYTDMTVSAKGMFHINDLNIDNFLINLPPITIELILKDTDASIFIKIENKIVTKHTIQQHPLKVSINSSAVLNFKIDNINGYESDVHTFIGSNTHLNIIFLKNGNLITNDSKMKIPTKDLKDKQYYQSVSESISNTIAYSTSYTFRNQCLGLLQYNQDSQLSVQEIVLAKVKDLDNVTNP